jgi:hypothetical protein
MFGAPGSIIPLTSLTPLVGPVETDVLPIQRNSPMQSVTAAQLRDYAVNSVKYYGALGDGVTDDTGAIQSAINTGLPFYFPAGIYVISQTLLFAASANHGQVARGAGPVATDGTGAGKTIIRPGPGVSVAIQIDGTGFDGYVQGFGFEDMTIDMDQMPDDSASVAILQGQAFGGRYRNVKIINDGTRKRGWKFITGSYTTSLYGCKANFVECTGLSTANGVTTLSFYDFDGNQLSTTYTNSITVIGGSWQGSETTKFKFRFGTDFWLKTDVEGTGVFLDVDTSVNALRTQCELQGFSGTYMNGAPAASSMLFDQQTNYNTYPFNMTYGYFQFNNQGEPARSSLHSGASDANYYLEIGRTNLELLLGVAAADNDFVPGTNAGDAVLGGWLSGGNLFLTAGSVPIAKLTPNGFNTFGTGQLKCGQIVLMPAADGADLFVIKNADGTGLIDITTSETSGASALTIAQGTKLVGYTDGFATQSWKIDSATGAVQAGSQIYPGSGTSSAPVVTTAAGILAGNGAPSTSIGNDGDFYLCGDGTHGSTNLIWHRESGSWVAIL